MYSPNDIIELINSINQKNNCIVFDYYNLIYELNILIEIINQYNLIYWSHGGTCLCFADSDNKFVYKFIIITETSKNFISESALLKKYNIEHLPIENILYMNERVIIYKQKYCRIINTINEKILYEIFKFIGKCIDNHIIINDVFYKNFCIDNNKIKIYDYHDVSSRPYTQNDIDYIHLNTMYNLCRYIDIDYANFTIEEAKKMLTNSNFKFTSESIYDMISNYIKGNSDSFSPIYEYLSNKHKNEYKIYQHVTVELNEILLSFHTYDKYLLAKQCVDMIADEYNNISILDAGCCIGGIALKLSETYNNVIVTCNNITVSELDVCKYIANTQCITNYIISDISILDVNQKYDITMYFAIIHHIMKSIDMDNILSMIKKQTNKISIIEVPLKGDKLLDIVYNDAQPDFRYNYECLSTVDTFKNELEKRFKVIQYKKIEYNTSDLIRYAFVVLIS